MEQEVSFKYIAEELRRTRLKRDITQTQLARLVKNKKYGQLICNIERAYCSMPDKRIGDFAKALNVKPGGFIKAKVKDYKERLLSENSIDRFRNIGTDALDIRDSLAGNCDRRPQDEGRKL